MDEVRYDDTLHVHDVHVAELLAGAAIATAATAAAVRYMYLFFLIIVE